MIKCMEHCEWSSSDRMLIAYSSSVVRRTRSPVAHVLYRDGKLHSFALRNLFPSDFDNPGFMNYIYLFGMAREDTF